MRIVENSYQIRNYDSYIYVTNLTLSWAFEIVLVETLFFKI